MKLLLVDDEVVFCNLISEFLTSQGFEIITTNTGYDCLALFEVEKPDLLILDLNLPDIYGVDICKKIREKNTRTPIFVLSANSDTESIVEALSHGADDYLTKPFKNEEMIARIKSLNRRFEINNSNGNIFNFDTLVIDLNALSVKRDGKTVILTNKEFALLVYLCQNAGKIIPRDTIMKDVWNINFDTQTNVVDVHISAIRKKVDGNSNNQLIHTVSGKGYLFSILEKKTFS